MSAFDRRFHVARTILLIAILAAVSGCNGDDDGVPRPTATATIPAIDTATVPPTQTRTQTLTSPGTATPSPTEAATATIPITPTPTEAPTETPTVEPTGPSFNAPVAGDQEVPPVETTASGMARITLSQDESELTYELSVEGLESSQITQAHIHIGPPGFNGPVVLFLADGPFESPLSGTLTEADLIPNGDVGVTNFGEFVERLRAGEAYVNVHSIANPSGEVRGQIPVPTLFVATLGGDQEVPPVETDASGTTTLTLSADETTLDFVLEVEGLESSQITQAHIHVAPRGFNGPVVLFLAAGPFESPLSGTLTEADLVASPDSGIESFADVVAALRAGDAYVNVHSVSDPSGEIRGQIQPPFALPADLEGLQEVPPVETEAGGSARIAVDAERGAIRFAVAVQNLPAGEITQAHIHVAPAGFNGPVVAFLAAGGFGPLLMGVLTADDLLPNADAGVNDFDELIAAILAGDAYVNVHSIAHMGGEIRGQIAAPITLPATLSGEEEVPPVATAASGRARFTVDAARERIRFTLQVQDIEAAQITQAHIHIAPRGYNGPVVLFLAAGPFSLRQGVLTAADLIARADVGVEDFDDLLEALAFGDGYVNVHSMANLAGEIRGQIQVPVEFPADLGGAAEVPPVETEGTGRARLVLNAEGDALDFALAVSGLDTGSITQAHVHTGEAGVNGPPVFFLAEGPFSFRRGRLTAENLIPGSGTFAEILERLRDGETYVNVHTEEHLDGEIRGQLRAPVTFDATLIGANEVPPVETEATGQARVVLNPDRDLLRFALAVQNLPAEEITQAHIHVGADDVNGPVVFFLADGPFNSPRIGTLDAENLLPAPGIGVDTFADFVLRLEAGETYVNVHTQDNMAGEIRGPLLP